MDRNRSFILISLVSGLFVIVMGVFVYTAPGLKDRFLADIPVTYSHGMDNLAKYATDGDWIYSDTPMDVYRAGLLVPPGIAVYSSKRLLTGNLNFDFQRQVLTGYEPSIVMLRRGLADDDLLAWISNRYCLTVVGDEDRHYLRKDLVNPSVCTVE